MRPYHYILFFLAMAVLAVALPYTGVVPRDGEITVKMSPHGVIAETPTYEPLPPRPYAYEQENISGCEFPELPDKAKLVLLSAYDTQSVSSTALGNEELVAVGAGTLTIEEGDTPLYIVLVSFDATIWQVKGAVERVRYLVLASQESTGSVLQSNRPHLETLVGATGIDANKVRFLRNHECMRYFKSADSPEAAQAVAAIKHYIGRAPDVVAGIEHVNGFFAPSGDIDQLSPSTWRILVLKVKLMLGMLKPGEAELRYEMESWHPGGVVDVDARSVVSYQDARPYTVLPEEAGLLQLLERGDLTPDDRYDQVFVINKAIRFPADLYGAHSRHFILPQGVAMPMGYPGHSCVYSQETRRAVMENDGFC